MRRRRRRTGVRESAATVDLAGDVAVHTETSPRLTGGDADADWHVVGSMAMRDPDVVDELGEALGVAQASDSEVVTSGEILRARDRHRWHLERDAVLREEQASAEQEAWA